MKRPVLPLNIPEYIAKTGHLTTVQHGAYLLLIMHYWTHGGLPDDEKIIQQITRLTNRQWFNNLNILRSYFLDHWRHKRLDEDLAQAIEISDKRSASAMQMHSKRTQFASVLHNGHELHSLSSSKERKERKSGIPLPEDWKPSEGDIATGNSLGHSNGAILNMAEEMRLWARANSNRAVARKADWSATFRGWMRRVKPEVNSGGGFPTAR